MTSLTSYTELLLSKPPEPKFKEVLSPRMVHPHLQDPRSECLLQSRTPGAPPIKAPIPTIIFHGNACTSLTTGPLFTFAPLKSILHQQLKALQWPPITLGKFEVLTIAYQALQDPPPSTSLAGSYFSLSWSLYSRHEGFQGRTTAGEGGRSRCRPKGVHCLQRISKRWKPWPTHLLFIITIS